MSGLAMPPRGARQEPRSGGATPDAGPPAALRVLIVEDNPGDAELLL